MLGSHGIFEFSFVQTFTHLLSCEQLCGFLLFFSVRNSLYVKLTSENLIWFRLMDLVGPLPLPHLRPHRDVEQGFLIWRLPRALGFPY